HTETTEAVADNTESTVVTHDAPVAPHRVMATKWAAKPMGTSDPVSARTHPGLSAAIRAALVTASSSRAKPAKIKSDRNDAAGVNARPTTRVTIAGAQPAIRAAKGSKQIVN